MKTHKTSFNNGQNNIHQYFFVPVEKIVLYTRGYRMAALSLVLIIWGHQKHVDKNILFTCLFLTGLFLTLKEFLRNELLKILIEIIKLRKGPK